MGLDVYLYEKAHHEQNARHEAEWIALYERQERGEITKAEREELDKTITRYISHVDVPSEAHPDHLFNRRYLRSSYNDGGFNHAVPDFLGTSADTEYPAARGSLYWIFEPMGREWDGDEGELTATDVDRLRACKARALEVADELRKCDPLGPEPAAILVYRADASSYIESAEITAEFCDEAISLIERDGSCYLSWSG